MEHARINLDISKITGGKPIAYSWLMDLERDPERDKIPGYVPFNMCSYGPGKIELECLPEDAESVREFVKGYLSEKMEECRRATRELLER